MQDNSDSAHTMQQRLVESGGVCCGPVNVQRVLITIQSVKQGLLGACRMLHNKIGLAAWYWFRNWLGISDVSKAACASQKMGLSADGYQCAICLIMYAAFGM